MSVANPPVPFSQSLTTDGALVWDGGRIKVGVLPASMGGGGGSGLSDGDYGDIVVSGSGTVISFDTGVVTAFAKAFLDDANAAAVRTTIGAGTSSFSGAFSALSGIPTTLSGYGITDAQPLDADLTSIAALTTAAFGRGLLALADVAAAQLALKIPTPLFDHFADVGNSGTSETDLYSDSISGGRLAANGEKLTIQYAGVFVSSGTATRQVRIYFGGTLIFDTGALTLSLSSAWNAYVDIIRVSSSVVRATASFTTEGAALSAYTAYTQVSGLTLANAQIAKATGTAGGVGAATNDIVAKMGSGLWVPAV